MKCSRCGEVGGGTHDVSGFLGGLNPPEGLRMVWTEDWRQGGELKGDNQSGSEKNLSQALTQGSLRRLQSWDGSQKGHVQNLLLVRSILPSAPRVPHLVITILCRFWHLFSLSMTHGSSSSLIALWFTVPPSISP